MCRLPLTCDLEALLEEPVPPEEPVHFIPTAELVQQQQQMEELYRCQKAKGGIIDLEHEKNKFLINEVCGRLLFCLSARQGGLSVTVWCFSWDE